MILNFKYLIVFTSAPGVLPEQNDRYKIQPWKVNEIKVYKNERIYFKVSVVLKNWTICLTEHVYWAGSFWNTRTTELSPKWRRSLTTIKHYHVTYKLIRYVRKKSVVQLTKYISWTFPPSLSDYYLWITKPSSLLFFF